MQDNLPLASITIAYLNKKYNWESESKKLLKVYEKLLKS